MINELQTGTMETNTLMALLEIKSKEWLEINTRCNKYTSGLFDLFSKCNNYTNYIEHPYL